MNKKLKRKWVAALRGDTYHQIRGMLGSDDHRCTLGVLVDVMQKSGQPSIACYRLVGEANYKEICRLNDQEKLTFPQIADWIEENV